MADNSRKTIFRTQLVRTEIHPFLKRIASLHSLDQNLDGHNQVVKKHNVKHKQLSLFISLHQQRKANKKQSVNPLRTVVAYMRHRNKYFTVRKQIIITLPAFTL